MHESEWRWRNVPLPEPHLGGLGIGIVLHLIAPWKLFRESWMAHALGWPAVIVGLSVAIWAVIAAGGMDMEEPKQIVVSGPYSHSRNPMYVAWSVIYVGIAFAVNTAWPLVVLPAVLLLTHIAVVREEHQLEGLFGAEFQRYKSRVGRYL